MTVNAARDPLSQIVNYGTYGPITYLKVLNTGLPFIPQTRCSRRSNYPGNFLHFLLKYVYVLSDSRYMNDELTLIDESNCVLSFNHQGPCMDQQMMVENCTGQFGPADDEGYFCSGCGAQYDDPDHGIALEVLS